jgi:hypothetical protein
VGTQRADHVDDAWRFAPGDVFDAAFQRGRQRAWSDALAFAERALRTLAREISI